MRQLLTVVQTGIPNNRSQVVAADLVELNPLRDIGQISAVVTAKLFKEMVDRMAFD